MTDKLLYVAMATFIAFCICAILSLWGIKATQFLLGPTEYSTGLEVHSFNSMEK